MKKKRNKIAFQMIPTPSRLLNLSNITKIKSNINNIRSNKNKETIDTEIIDSKRTKSNSVKVNKNIVKHKYPPKRLNTINIINKKIDVLYDWNILLNNKSPGIYYKKSDYEKLSINNFETENNIPQNSLILLDIPESQIKKYFGKKSFLKFDKHPKTAKGRSSPFQKKEELKKISRKSFNDILEEYDSNIVHNNIRPASLNSPREPHQPFYFSNDFNNYYKYDFKHFAQILPNLKAKIKTSNKKLMKEIINLKYNMKKDSNNLKEFLAGDEKIFKIQDLIIAGIRNNPARLMKNLYMLKHPNYKKVKQEKRMYFKTMKPIGEYFGEIDFTKNERWRTYYELKKLKKNDKKFFTLENNKNSNYKTNLTLSYYKATDPHIKYFNRLVKKYNRLNQEKYDDNDLLYTKGFSIGNKKNKENKIIETDNDKNIYFFRDKLIKNDYKYNNKNNHNNKGQQVGNSNLFFKQNYNNYFITETTKNSNNE